ncbi:MAG: site-specific DNA-methyltransferase [Elusimicrobia bacterium]|nr:site-specific DNA-methyltransferase [Elusimicrobiota bacterium]
MLLVSAPAPTSSPKAKGVNDFWSGVNAPDVVWEDVEVSGLRGVRATQSFWTVRQRQACSLHEVSYRACFKPQLPRYFIERLTQPGDVVYDPFSGRGTTGIEAGLLGRRVIMNDANPLGVLLARPRFFIPDLAELETRLRSIDLTEQRRADRDLSMFYHPQTESALVGLKTYLDERRKAGVDDDLDHWIRMVATNRLTGHSSGFFSVYSLPPNQAASPQSQLKINARLNQTPEPRDVVKIILKKSKNLISDISPEDAARLRNAGSQGQFLCEDARRTAEIKDGTVQLVVTSPPFLDVVQYAQDNWLRFWFNGISAEETGKRLSMHRKLDDWARAMGDVFQELSRVVAPNGWVAFEVGEVSGGSIKLDETVVPLGGKAGFHFEGVLINQQIFTKTSNIWGINNNSKGTNTNRIVLFSKKELS